MTRSIASDSSTCRALSKVLGRGVFFAAALLAAVSPASGQTFPNKPVRIIVPYGVGGVVDFVPRVLAERMSAELGQPVVVENKSGGLGIPAMNEVLNSPPDGHFMIEVDAAHWAINPALTQVNYNFTRDFAPVTLVFTNGLVFFTSTTSGINSFEGLVALAKAKPGQLNYGSSGIGSTHHLAIESLKASLGLDIKHVPYRGGAEMAESVMRGDTHFSVVSMGTILPLVKAGKLKMLAVSIPTRLKQIPDVPTVAEVTGLKDYSFPGQAGFVVKAGTPKAIIDKLAAAFTKAAQQPDLAAKVLDTTASELTPSTPEQLTELIRRDIVKFANAVKASGAKLE